MRLIPINDVYSQTLTTTAGGQYCRINLYQKATGLYFDLYLNDVLLNAGVICENLNRLVRDRYLGFLGDFMFQDMQGSDDPSSPGLGSRFLFYYLELADIANLA